MALNEAEMKIDDTGKRVTITLPLWQILTVVLGGASIVGSVWLTTRDLGRDVARLSGSVDTLVVQLAEQGRRYDGLDRRVWKLEESTTQ